MGRSGGQFLLRCRFSTFLWSDRFEIGADFLGHIVDGFLYLDGSWFQFRGDIYPNVYIIK